MRWGLMLVAMVIWVGNAQAAADEGGGSPYLAACAGELQKLNLPVSTSDCERLLERSHLIQSDAIRYLAQANDAGKLAFGTASTLKRYEMMEQDVDHAALMSVILKEQDAAASGMLGQLVKDIMKPSCGYYQIDILMKALENVNALPQPPKQVSRKSAPIAYKSCLGGVLPDGKVSECLNPIFQLVTSEPSPNP